MRVILAAIVVLLSAAPAFAASQITCAQIPEAQRFIAELRPGPNTRAAQHWLDAARHAKSDKQCVLDLGHVNYYAKRSAAADRRLARIEAEKAREARKSAHRTTLEAAPPPSRPAAAGQADLATAASVKAAPAKTAPAGRVKCADLLHEDRPGGTDYHGPPVPGCKRPF